MNSTNASTNPRQPDADGDPGKGPETKAAKMDLSLTQTMGGALAAMTAAALGSRLGVAGTIVGAALASIIAGVAGAFYTASLRTTREKVKTVWSGRVAGTDTKASIDVVDEPPVWDDAQTATREIPRVAVATPAPSSAPRPRRSLPWKGMLVGAFAAFAIAVVALTGFELLSGSALSGGKGTTIQQVTGDQKPAADPTSDSTPSKSASPKDSATPTPSATPSATPSPSETPVAPPTEAPTTDQPTPTQSPSEQSEQTASPSPSETPTTSTSAEGAEAG